MGGEEFDDMNAIMKNMGLCVVYMLTHFMIPYTFVFIFAVMILYGSKVYQAGLIPTDVNCFPYVSDISNNVQMQPKLGFVRKVNINKTRDGKAERMVFTYEKDKIDYSVLCGKYIRGLYEEDSPDDKNNPEDSFKPKGSFTYWLATFIKLFSSYIFLFWAGIFSVIKMIGEILSMFIIVFFFYFMQLIPSGYGSIILMIPTIYFIYATIVSWFKGFHFLTEKNLSWTPTDKEKNNGKYTGKLWEDHLSFAMFKSPGNGFRWFGNAFIFLVMGMIGIMQIFTPMIPTIGLVSSIIYLICICCTESKIETQDGKFIKYGFIGFLRDAFKYKMWIYMLLIAIGLSVAIQMYFGAKVFLIMLICIIIVMAMFINKAFNMKPEFAQTPVPDIDLKKNKCEQKEKKITSAPPKTPPSKNGAPSDPHSSHRATTDTTSSASGPNKIVEEIKGQKFLEAMGIGSAFMLILGVALLIIVFVALGPSPAIAIVACTFIIGSMYMMGNSLSFGFDKTKNTLPGPLKKFLGIDETGGTDEKKGGEGGEGGVTNVPGSGLPGTQFQELGQHLQTSLGPIQKQMQSGLQGVANQALGNVQDVLKNPQTEKLFSNAMNAAAPIGAAATAATIARVNPQQIMSMTNQRQQGGASFTPLKISGGRQRQTSKKARQSGGANYLEAYQNLLRILQN